MSNKVFFKEVQKEIEIINDIEMIEMNEDFRDSFIKILPSFFSYQEEEKSINPRIIFSRNFDNIGKTIPYLKKIKIATGNTNGSDLKKRLKTIMPFCNNSWILYIEFKENLVEYGIIRSFSSIDGFSTEEQLFLGPIISSDSALLFIQLLSKFELYFKGIRDTNTIIDFRFHSEINQKKETTVQEFCSALISGYNDKNKKKCEISLKKIIDNLLGKSKGTIIVILSNSCNNLPDDIFTDGIWFDEPVDLVGEIFNILNYKDKFIPMQISEKFYALSGLLYEMANVDGATCINDKGQILGYNCFARSNSDKDMDKNLAGGARKRAFSNILSWENPDVIGALFHSQDGELIFKKGK